MLPVILGVGALTTGGLLALALSGGGDEDALAPASLPPVSADVTAGAQPLEGLPGVWAKPGVVLNPQLRTFLAVLRAETDPRVPIVVTSGVRTAEAQAAALKRKRDLGDDLTQLYRRGRGPEIVVSLLAVSNTVAAMAGVLVGWMQRGVYMSRHMRGDALDLRTRGLATAHVNHLVAVARSLNARALVEKTPPHLHLERLAELPSA